LEVKLAGKVIKWAKESNFYGTTNLEKDKLKY